MKSLRVLVVIGLLAASPGLAGQSGLSPEALLKAAISREVVDGDIPGAIAQYKEIALTYAGNHPVAAGALLRLADLFERIGEPEARATYQQIVKEYPDVGAVASTARTRLLKIQQAAAGPFRTRSVDSYLKDAAFISGSPDGRFVAYTRPQAGKTVTIDGVAEPMQMMCIRELDSGNERILVEPKDSNLARSALVWSPDSRRVAYVVRLANQRVERRVITVSNRETRALGQAPSQAAANFTWSPNSQHLVFGTKTTADGPFEVQLATLGSERVSTVGPSLAQWSGVAWSADSSRVAYLAPQISGGNAIRVVSLAGEELRTLAVPALAPNGRTTVAHWTKDDRILFSQNINGGNDYFSILSGGGAARKICEGRGSAGGDGCQGYSPDGLLQIVRKNVSGGGRIVLRNTATGNERPLTPEAVTEQTVVGFSRDGRLFAFRSNRNGPWATYVVPTDQIPVANPVKIASMEFGSSTAGGWWTPAGLVLRINDSQSNLYRVDVDPRTGRAAGPPVRLTERAPTNGQPFVSPDGQRIAHVARDGGPAGFAVMEANGTGERLVYAVPPDMLLRMRLLGWRSPEELVFSDAGLGTGLINRAPRTLNILNIRTSQVTALPGPPIAGSGISYVPAVGTVFLAPPGTSRLVGRPLGGGADNVTTLPDDWMYDAISADARVIAYSTADYGKDGKRVPVTGDIRVRQRGGTEDRILIRYPDAKDGDDHAPIAFSPDSRYLLYRDPTLELRVLNLDTTESWPLITANPANVDFEWAAARWSPNGAFIVLEGYTSRVSWRAIDGVTYDAVTKILGRR